MTSEMQFVDNPAATRFELRDGPELAAIAVYRRRTGLIAFVHTEVMDGHDGQGSSSDLIRRALDEARRGSLAVLPFCPFVKGYIQRHGEYVDLVPVDRRTEFGL